MKTLDAASAWPEESAVGRLADASTEMVDLAARARPANRLATRTNSAIYRRACVPLGQITLCDWCLWPARLKAVLRWWAFQLALGTLRAESQVAEAFRTGSGIGWHQHDHEVFAGCERFFRPSDAATLSPDGFPR